MLSIISYIIFTLSVGLTFLGLITASRLRKEYQNGFASALLYFQIFAYTFGFYGIWGQVFVDKFLESYLPTNIMERIITYQALLGLPFMILTWYMMIRFAFKLQMYIMSRITTVSFISIAGGGLIVIVYLAFNPGNIPQQLYIFYYIIMGLISHLLTGIVLFGRPASKTRIKRKKLNLLAILTILAGIIQSTILYFFDMSGYLALVFVIVYFSCYAFVPFILRYSGILTSYIRTGEEELNLDDFCTRFELSHREKEIVIEMCKGQTNKEIADSLFISLQTVKDHTHRIYIKTGLRNRVELVNRIRNVTSS